MNNMEFNEETFINGTHAYLSPSSNSWLNYDKEKLINVYNNLKKKEEGTVLHEFANQAIKLKIKLEKNNKALNNFVNDAIYYNMKSEQQLYYSEYCFGTADAISFKNNILMIFDLKTGNNKSKKHFIQLQVYAALFCLEYKIDPFSIKVEGRIYQGEDITIIEDFNENINSIMKKIIEADLILKEYEERMENYG